MEELYRVRKGQVAVVDVPELDYLSIQGRGVPGGPEFQHAATLLRTATAGCPRMPIEALWWVDEAVLTDLVRDLTQGRTSRMDLPPDCWRWQALVRAPDPATAEAIAGATDGIRYLRWAEGPSVQVLHVGPYAAEGPAVRRLYAAIDAAGCRPRGRHHEIYLNQRPTTLLRQPIEAPRKAALTGAGRPGGHAALAAHPARY
ncbi:MAG TPA: GyrI-like domain-containing protein [Actinophytocola sp.]|uniref:GyrI-like domain-containing protein n=1 Tax=Actinophytocola sp. TaxID=1872138 RepID=UPI002DBF5055|nr:GyrI-like domain-containing protein [Actinophytocola sp.]HEU5469300.1 GyrI-like domain-containing protein [Actinophytocola sp.]